MIFNNGDEKEAITILLEVLSKLKNQTEYNAVCFAIDCLQAIDTKKPRGHGITPSRPSHEEIGYEESHGIMEDWR